MLPFRLFASSWNQIVHWTHTAGRETSGDHTINRAENAEIISDNSPYKVELKFYNITKCVCMCVSVCLRARARACVHVCVSESRDMKCVSLLPFANWISDFRRKRPNETEQPHVSTLGVLQSTSQHASDMLRNRPSTAIYCSKQINITY